MLCGSRMVLMQFSHIDNLIISKSCVMPNNKCHPATVMVVMVSAVDTAVMVRIYPLLPIVRNYLTGLHCI